MDLTNVVGSVLLGIFLLIVIAVSFKSCKSGSQDADYHIVCIRGHTYYRSNFGSKMGLAIALDNDGKPIRCVVVNH